jgi:hypothetical protein
MTEALIWLVVIVVIVFLLWKGGGYRVAGLIALGVAAWVAERRYLRRRQTVLLTERKAADAFSVRVAPRIHERRRRQAEYYKARQELERLEVEYVTAKEERAGRVADLWNASFGRPTGTGEPAATADDPPDPDEEEPPG